MGGKHLTENEIKSIRKKWLDGNTINAISKELKRNRATIRKCILDIKDLRDPVIDTRSRFSLDQDQFEKILSDHNEDMTQKDLAKKFNVSQASISRILYAEGERLSRKDVALRISDSRKNYTLNNKVFDTLNEKSAYWLGFILADGNIITKKYSGRVRIELHEKDKEHIELFKSFLETDKEIQIDTRKRGFVEKDITSYYISISDHNIIGRVLDYGIIPRKTYDFEGVHEDLKNNRHFWRGAVDGDGWISDREKSNKWKSRIIAIGLCGHKLTVEGFVDVVMHNIEVERNYEPKQASEHCWNFEVQQQTAYRIINLLYGDTNYGLKRKVKKAHHILRTFEKKKLYTPQFTNLQKDKIVRMYKSGLSSIQIAKKLNTNKHKILRVLVKRNVPRRINQRG